MTVEELNIKISADAENFKKGIADANASIESFRKTAVEAGEQVTAAFDGLITVSAYTGETASADSGSSAVSAVTPVSDGSVTAQPSYWASGGVPTIDGTGLNTFISRFTSSPRTANVLDLSSSETVIGAVSENGSSDSTPVNITTTVELDGDKVGASVNRFNMRRNKITNGIYG